MTTLIEEHKLTAGTHPVSSVLDYPHGVSGSPGATSSNMTVPRVGYSSAPTLTSRASSGSLAKEGSPRDFTASRYRFSPLPSPPLPATSIAMESSMPTEGTETSLPRTAVLSHPADMRVQEVRWQNRADGGGQRAEKKPNYRPFVSSPGTAAGAERVEARIGTAAALQEETMENERHDVKPRPASTSIATDQPGAAESGLAMRSSPVTLPPSELIMRQRDRIHSLVAERHQHQMQYQDLWEDFEGLKKEYEQHLSAEEARREDLINQQDQERDRFAETLAGKDAQIEKLRLELSLSQKAAEEVIVRAQARLEAEHQKMIQDLKQERELLERENEEKVTAAMEEVSRTRNSIEQELQSQLRTREAQWVQHSEGLQAQLEMLMEELQDALEERRILLEDRTNLRREVEDRTRELENAKQTFYQQELPKALIDAEKRMLEVVKGKEQALLLREEAFEVSREQLEASRFQWQQRAEKESVTVEQYEFRIRSLQETVKEKENLVQDLRVELLQVQKDAWRKESATGANGSSLIKEHERRYEKLQGEYRQLQKQQLEESEASSQKFQRMQLQERQRTAEHTLHMEEVSHRAVRAENALKQAQRQLQEQMEVQEKKEEEIQRVTLDLHRTRRDFEALQAKLHHFENDARKVKDEKDELLRERQVLLLQLKHTKHKNVIQEKELSGYRTELWHLQAKLWSHGLRFAPYNSDPLSSIAADESTPDPLTAIQPNVDRDVERGNKALDFLPHQVVDAEVSAESRTPTRATHPRDCDGEEEEEGRGRGKKALQRLNSPPTSSSSKRRGMVTPPRSENDPGCTEHVSLHEQAQQHAGLVRSPPQSPTPTSHEYTVRKPKSMSPGKKALSGKKERESSMEKSHVYRDGISKTTRTAPLEGMEADPQIHHELNSTYSRSLSSSSKGSSGAESEEAYSNAESDGECDAGGECGMQRRGRRVASHRRSSRRCSHSSTQKGREALPPAPAPHLSKQFFVQYPLSPTKMSAAGGGAGAGAGGSLFLSTLSSLTTPSGLSFLPQACQSPPTSTARNSTRGTKTKRDGTSAREQEAKKWPHATSHKYDQRMEQQGRKGDRVSQPPSFLTVARKMPCVPVAIPKKESTTVAQKEEDDAEIWFDDPLLSLGGSGLVLSQMNGKDTASPPRHDAPHSTATASPGSLSSVRPLSIERSQDNPVALAAAANTPATTPSSLASPQEPLPQKRELGGNGMEENRLDDQPVFPGVTKTLSGVPLASSPLTSTFVPSVGEPPAIRHGEASPHADGGVSRNMVGANVEQGGIPTPRGGHPMPRCDGFADNGSPGSQEDGEAMRGGPHTSFHSVSVGSSAVSGGVGGGGEPGCDVVRKHSMLPPAPSGRLHTSTAAISAATVATSLAAATISSSSGALQSLSNSLDVAMERYVAATSKLPFRPGASYDEPTTDDAVMVEHSNTRSTVPLTLGELIQRQKDTIQRVSQPLPRHHHSLRGNEEEEEGSFVEKPSPVRPVDKYTENLQRKEGLSRPAARHLAGASHSSAEEDEMYLLMDADEEDGDDMEDVEWIIHKSHTRPQSSPPSRQVTEVTSEVDHRMDDSARDEEERVIANDQRSPHRPNRTSYPTSHSARVVGSSFSSSVALPVHPSTPNNRSFVAARTSTSTSSSVASPSTSRKFTAQTGHLPSRLETLRESFLLPFASSSRADALFTDHHNTDGA